MFISLSKTLTRFGGFRVGLGMRLNKKNAIWLTLIIMFIAIFKLMWYVILLSAWMVYAVFYGMYWCIKKIVQAIKHSKESQKSTGNNIEEEEEITMNTEMKGNESKTPKNKTPKNISAIVRWIVGGFFTVCVFVSGLHYSSLFFIAAAFLMFPFPFIAAFLEKIKVKTVVAVVLSVALFFAGALTMPLTEAAEGDTEESEQKITDDYEEKTENTQTESKDTQATSSTEKKTEEAKKEETTAADEKKESSTSNNTVVVPNSGTTKDEDEIMVWIPSSGTKYHSRSDCSNMSSPSKISIEKAQQYGYEPCKKCY